MKVDDFLTAKDCATHAVEGAKVETVEESVRSLTPSGIEVFYSWSPRRHYKLKQHGRVVECDAKDVAAVSELLALEDWVEVPSVTTVLNVLDKSGALTWWGQSVGAEGVVTLLDREVLRHYSEDGAKEILQVKEGTLDELEWAQVTKKNLVDALTRERLTVNHQTASAATRGVNVHSALEKWCEDTSYRPILDTYPESEQGYIRGLIKFLDDFGPVADVEAEVMVGSIAHGFAGRYDLRLTKAFPADVVTRTYPKRKDKVETIGSGKYLIDLKTSKSVYPTHALQLAAYEMASVECGYGPTDHRAVVHVTADGQYELVLTHATSEDFLSVLATHNTMSKSKGWT